MTRTSRHIAFLLLAAAGWGAPGTAGQPDGVPEAAPVGGLAPVLQWAEFHFTPGGERLVAARHLSRRNEPLVSVHHPRPGESIGDVYPPLVGSDLFGKAELAADRPGLPWGVAAFRRDGVSVALGPDGQEFATYSSRTVRLWETATGKPIGPALELGGSTRVAFSRDRKRLLVANLTTGGRPRVGYELRYADVLTGKTIGEPAAGPATGATLPPAFAALKDLVWTPDESGFVTAYTGANKAATVLRFWDAKTLAPVGDPFPGGGDVHAFARDGRTLLVVSQEEIALWDVAGRKRVGRLPTPDVAKHLGGGSVRELARVRPWFAALPDAARVLVRDPGPGPAGKTVRLWDLGTEPPTEKRVLPHADAVYWVAASPDGRTAATCTVRDGLLLWDLDTGRPRLRVPLAAHPDNRLRGLAFSPDGRLLAVAEDPGTRVWSLAPPE
ncbi:MAG TPA: hypothetical protein VH092_07535 [Urbifossiella sp.]|jgi:WD40 repeat protein|nr:hypothetical protein [Urbifossiella sp.]